MSHDPAPWSRGGPVSAEEQAAVRAVTRTSEIAPRPVELSAGWDAVLERATKPSRAGWRVLTVALVSLAVVVAGVVRLQRGAPVVVAAADAHWEQRTDGGVHLTRGRVETTRAVAVSLESPQVSVLTRGARFAAEVVAEGTRVTVFEGDVVVRSGGEDRVLHAGESVLWPVAPELPAALELPPARPSGCTGSASEQRDCLALLAAGEDLSAEVAAFELGRLAARAGDDAGAAEHWRTLLTRFPEGVFTPEVRLGLLGALTRQRRFVEAAQVARDFERDHGEDPRLAEVTRLREQLEHIAP